MCWIRAGNASFLSGRRLLFVLSLSSAFHCTEPERTLNYCSRTGFICLDDFIGWLEKEYRRTQTDNEFVIVFRAYELGRGTKRNDATLGMAERERKRDLFMVSK